MLPDTTADIYLSYYGHERCKPGHRYGPAVRDHYLFVYVEKGKGIYQANGREISLSKGESFILFPNVRTLYKADMHEPWEYKWAGFSGANIEKVLRKCGISPAEPVLGHSRPERIARILDGLLDYESVNGEADRLFYDGSIRLLLSEIGRDRIGQSVRRLDQRILQAMNFVFQHYDKKILVATIAEYIGMERSYFTKCFKAETGKSPYEYILEIRMARAKQLLEQTDLPVEHIALMIGFNDTFHFSAMFKKRTGHSPLKYRKVVSEKNLI